MVHLQAVIFCHFTVGECNTDMFLRWVDDMENIFLRDVVIHLIAHVIDGNADTRLLAVYHYKTSVRWSGVCVCG